TVFVAQTSFYLSSSAAPKKVVAQQASAIRQAWAGKDVALQRFTQIRVPTLVADGASDRLVPAANASELAAGIAGSKLELYKGAGHAFLFQDLAAFVPAVESFLYGP
ncbi:MAG TPA: alpha/beta hydrolase, partial [Acidimicrobiales bacterium]|nr:alpha/beta hydrolase [Acidimicrobiales bacterium]